MNPKTTWGLTALAAGLFAYIYFFELRADHASAGASTPARLLPNLDPSAVSRVEIIRTNQVIRAELINDQWQLLTPPYPAQSTAIESFLRSLTNLTRHSEIPAHEIIAESGGLSPFGLDPARATIKLQAGTNQFQLRVGSKTLVGDRVYVQPVGASGIFTTDVALLEHLPESASQWRNPMLVQPANLNVDRIAITTGSRPLKLERDPATQLWRLVLPMPTRADFSRVEYMLQRLRSARISQFVTDEPPRESDSFGLQPPEAELSLGSGGNTVFQVQFGKSPTNDPTQVYARVGGHTNVVLVSHELAELVQKPYTEFRDRVLLSFRPSQVDRIEAQVVTEPKTGQTNSAPETFAVQRQTEHEWQIVEPFVANADRQLMQLFLEDLGKLEIIRCEKEVVADFAPYGLVKPVRQYVLKNSLTNAAAVTNQTLVQIDFGLPPPNEPDKVFCRRSDEKSAYVVAFADMGRLERAAFALRDRRIWAFAASNVTSLTIVQHNQRRELARDPVSRSWFREDQVASAAIDETLHRIGELKADAWVARGEDQAKVLKADGSEYQLLLNLSENGKTRKLTLNLRLGVRGQTYGSVILEENQPVVFKFPPNLYALIVQFLSVPSASAEL
jgi:hypothetical protein